MPQLNLTTFIDQSIGVVCIYTLVYLYCYTTLLPRIFFNLQTRLFFFNNVSLDLFQVFYKFRYINSHILKLNKHTQQFIAWAQYNFLNFIDFYLKKKKQTKLFLVNIIPINVKFNFLNCFKLFFFHVCQFPINFICFNKFLLLCKNNKNLLMQIFLFTRLI